MIRFRGQGAEGLMAAEFIIAGLLTLALLLYLVYALLYPERL